VSSSSPPRWPRWERARLQRRADAATDPGVGYVHANTDYTKLVPETVECDSPDACQPVNQQDNYLSRFTYP
jgi:hypothetical protein